MGYIVLGFSSCYTPENQTAFILILMLQLMNTLILFEKYNRKDEYEFIVRRTPIPVVHWDPRDRQRDHMYTIPSFFTNVADLFILTFYCIISSIYKYVILCFTKHHQARLYYCITIYNTKKNRTITSKVLKIWLNH